MALAVASGLGFPVGGEAQRRSRVLRADDARRRNQHAFAGEGTQRLLEQQAANVASILGHDQMALGGGGDGDGGHARGGAVDDEDDDDMLMRRMTVRRTDTPESER